MNIDENVQKNECSCNTENGKKMMEMLETERKRIVSELHDTSLQNIAHLVHMIELASLYIDKDPARAKMELNSVSKGLHNVIEDIRSTIFNLRPMTFDDLGLKASFERLLDFLNADKDYIMDVEIDDVSCETDDYFCITLYRVVQECLLNIKKHSQATRVLFHCKKTEQKYEILIQDNGKGFTMEEAEDKANSHFGLALIHEGVNLLNGTIHVSSAIGRGTTIDIKIPLDLHSAVKKEQLGQSISIHKQVRIYMSIKVMFADDHVLMREGIRQLLEFDGTISVIAEANNGVECMEQLLSVHPDILLLDINMPVMNGIEVLQEIKKKNISVKVLVLTVHNEVEYLLKAVDIGIDGYIMKDAESAELKKAINCIMQGETYIQPSLVPALNSRLVSRDIDKGKINSLTNRELEVLIEVANGMFNKEIATSLNISERTVKNHISNIFKKIDVSDRTQAAVFAIKNNLIKLY